MSYTIYIERPEVTQSDHTLTPRLVKHVGKTPAGTSHDWLRATESDIRINKEIDIGIQSIGNFHN